MKKVIYTIVGFVFMWSTSVYADLTIQIDQSSDNAVPIALVPFEWKGAQLHPPQNITSIVGNDLLRSGKFKAVDEAKLPSRPKTLDDIDFYQWKQLGVDNLLMGRITEEANGTYQIEMRFVDLLRKEQVIGKRWSGISKSLLRQVAHKMSDLIYEELTGIRGAFNTRMAYVTVRNVKGKKQYSLEVADSDGYNSQPILRSSLPIMSPSWSPDGQHLAYVSFENGRSQIVLQSLDGKSRQIIAKFKGINGAPAWSPDGKKLALTLSKDGSADVYIMDMKTRKLRRLTRNWAIETEAVWAPNGHSLFFNSDRRGQPQIFQVFLDTGEMRRISYVGRYNANPAISPDGRYVAMVHANGGFHIAVLDLYNEDFNILTKTYLDESPTFSPNGEMILYAMNQGGQGKLAVVSVNSNVTQILSVQEGEVRSPSWGPYLPR
ncbi:MAG: Tol-Pal system beta propeller repeat protein TolB [Hydrogenovibrio crunogenus]|uniref:Tol-Pal system protein TolB n=1 Tax=Hydrogenovibrio crunogenus (strain DSM 25203 / XCL-2) TaxID=317025 RepID=TOLB_HYDCU|nr:RecName: Full=Tol-Pal system protein TolB; Flags: Precursor [Hydrogenovibrio crunogenus XCL-2]MBD3611875.1 Tol-Pal system beta propeller repeat protein TolB [Hydrogenovibrio crunogenus]